MNFWLKCFYFLSILILVGAENQKKCTVKEVKIKKLTNSSATISWSPLKQQSPNEVTQYSVTFCDTHKLDQNNSCPDENVTRSIETKSTLKNNFGRIEVKLTELALETNYSIYIISLASNESRAAPYSFRFTLEKENNTTEKLINESLTCNVSQDQTSAKDSTMGSILWTIFGIVLVCIILGGGLFAYRWVNEK